MQPARLKIDRQPVGLDAVWVHCKKAPDPLSSECSLLVRGDFVKDTFDPHGRKSPGDSWEAYIMNELGQFGTAVLSSYIERILNVSTPERGPKQWVLTSVRKALISSEGIVLEGTAEPFDIKRAPVPAPLR